jgi:hypothetical protein
MNSIKCRNCRLVNPESRYDCQRCGFELTEPVQLRSSRTKKSSSGGLSFPVKLALVAAFGYIAYTYFGGGEEPPVLNTTAANRPVAKPQPTLSMRSEYEQHQTSSYKNAVQSSPGLAQSQKRLEETQKLMQSEPPKQAR